MVPVQTIGVKQAQFIKPEFVPLLGGLRHFVINFRGGTHLLFFASDALMLLHQMQSPNVPSS
jgi:hypothetical protein